MWWLVVAVVGLAIAGGLYARHRHGSRPPDGPTTFRRHMDALSSDARRDVIDRVNDAGTKGRGGRHGS